LEERLKEFVTLRSGAKIPRIKKKDADSQKYITRSVLMQMHLSPKGDPVAFDRNEDGTILYYFDPTRVTETPPELWYRDRSEEFEANPDTTASEKTREDRQDEEMTLESGTVIYRMSTRRAASYGYYTKERLSQMMYETVEEPVAFSRKNDKSVIYFYDKRTANRLPLVCVRCGKDVRYRRKLCKECYEQDLAERRAEGDAHRSAYYAMDPARVLFFDLELTGVYNHDEIISISIVDGNEQLIMDTLVKPVHTKRWKRTEKIHGITPAMVQDAPTLAELTPRIKELFEGCDNLIAYGVSTDYSHIKKIYATEKEQLALHDKVRCCANEFVRFTHEHRPDVRHAALVDAMECFGVGWDGIPHSSVADTFACCRVWHKLFPRYYEGEQEASLDVPTYEVHHHDKAGNIIPEEDEMVLDAAELTEAEDSAEELTV
jgi:DNA polymerase-3 subunit epsilon